VAASCNCELTCDGRKHALDLVAQGDEDGDGDHGNESENQGILHESLALLALHPAQRDFSASNNFVDHCFSPPLNKKMFKNIQKLRLSQATVSLSMKVSLTMIISYANRKIGMKRIILYK
jgi:hypothetical protein